MRAGKYKHRVEVDKANPVQNDTGEEVPDFLPFGVIWCSIEPRNGREALIGNQPLAEMDTRIFTRWSPNSNLIQQSWRLRFGAIVYDIKDLVHIDMGHREIEFRCKSGLNNG